MANTKTYIDTLASATSVANDYIIVVQNSSNASSVSSMEKATVGQLREPIVTQIANNAHNDEITSGKYVAGLEQTEEGKVNAKTKDFDTAIEASSANAPSSQAVINYVQKVRTGDIKSDIASAVEALKTNEAIGGDKKYIKLISQTNGTIAATAEDLEEDLTRENSIKAPTSHAVKTYVDNKINTLGYNNGGATTLIQSIDQTAGKISATTINLDSTISSEVSGVPTSQAVRGLVDSLTGVVGSTTGTLITSLVEKNGKISGGTIKITDTVVNDAGIPTSQAVYNKVNETLISALKELDHEAGQPGFYFDKIIQKDGQIETNLKQFDGAIDNSASKDNVPSTLAVKKYVDTNREALDDRINKLTGGNAGTSGTFLRQITQASGAITVASEVPFMSSSLATSKPGEHTVDPTSYKKSDDTAPTVRAVTEQIERLDKRIDDANAGLTSLTAGPFGSTGSFISSVSQNEGYLRAASTAFLSSVPETVTENDNIAPSAYAVRTAINKLDVNAIGSAGSYIRFVSETDGKVSAEPVEFDGFASNASTASWATATNENAPSTLAVYNFVNRVKDDILTSTEAMTYEGTVATYNEISAKKTYDKGDVYIASGKFNLEKSEGVQVKYNVNVGDMLICKESKSSYDMDNFDIIGGSEYQIVYGGGLTKTTPKNIPVFDDERGIVLVDSGESIETIKLRQASAASSAQVAKTYAASAASSASFADAQVEPYRKNASSSASATYEALTGAQNSSTAAATAMSGAQSSSSAAYKALTGAQNSSTAAVTAMSGARLYSNAAATAMSGAQNSSAAAATAMSGAQDSSLAAATAMSATENYCSAAFEALTGARSSSDSAENLATAASQHAAFADSSATSAGSSATTANTAARAATGYMSSALKSLNTTTGYQNSAKSAMSGAQDSSTAAYQALTGAQNSSNVAASKSDAASKSASYAAGYEANAKASASKAASYADDANLEGILLLTQEASRGASASSEAASKFAASAAQSAINAASSEKVVTDFAQAANLEKIKSDAQSALSTTTGYQSSASTAAARAQDSSNAALVAATKAQASSKAASESLGATTGYQSSASAAAAQASQSAKDAAAYAASANLERILTGSTQAAYRAETAATKAESTVTNKLDKTTTDTQTMAGGLVVGTTTSGVTLTTTGSVSATSFTATSSRKLKENIHPALISALDLIETVDVVNFNYINDDEKTPHVGFIAEDTDSLLSTPHQNKMDYTNCIGVLLKAVQEITKGMSELKKEVDSLK